MTTRGSSAWLYACIEKGRTEVFTEIVDLTPELAKTILDLNVDNRALRPTKLQQYISDAEKGAWQLNGETIVFSNTGLLNNGQHRCHMSKEAKMTVPVIMVFGVERDSRTTLDQGNTRSAG